MDLLTADKISVYCQPMWFEQLLSAPFVISKTDATVFLHDVSLADSDIVGLDEELARFSTSGKHSSDTILESTSPLKRRRVTLGPVHSTSDSTSGLSHCASGSSTASTGLPILPFNSVDFPAPPANGHSLFSAPVSTPSPLASAESPPSRKSANGKKQFPWKYVCDMYPGMVILSSLGTAEEIEKKFPLVFPNTVFVLSTFYKHRKPFLDASSLQLVEPRVALGHTEGGKWSLLKTDTERLVKEGMCMSNRTFICS